MTRPLFSDTSPPPVGGPSFLAQDFAVKNLTLEAATAPLTNVALDGGAVNAITADIRDLFVDGDFVAGQAIRFAYPGAANAPGGVTIELTPVDAAGTATAGPITKDLLTADGSALVEDQLTAGLMVQAVYHAGAFQITSSIFGTNEASRFHWQYVESAVWSKPLGLNPDTLVTVLARAAGGGGNLSRGGGGGGAAVRWMTLSEIARDGKRRDRRARCGRVVERAGRCGRQHLVWQPPDRVRRWACRCVGVGAARTGWRALRAGRRQLNRSDVAIRGRRDRPSCRAAMVGRISGGVLSGAAAVAFSGRSDLRWGLSLYSGDGGGPDESGGLPLGRRWIAR
jgi:hypothetical protein